MKTIKFSEAVEKVLVIFVGIFCVLIPVLDFAGVFDNVVWVKERISVFILLTIGFLTTYLVSHLNNKEDKAIERQRELLRSIKLDEASARFKDLLESCWQKRQKDIEKLFSQVPEQIRQGSTLEQFLSTSFERMLGGDYFGAKVALPWDFTLCALTYEGVVIYHPSIPKDQRLDDYVAQIAIKERNGSAFWENDLCSEQLGSIFPHRAPGNKRFTKFYYKDFPDLQAVVIFESHVNIIDKLPPIKLTKAQTVPS